MDTSSEFAAHFINMFSGLTDTRRRAGQRHSFGFVMLIAFLAIFSGYSGYQAFNDFIRRHRADLIRLFRPAKDRIPSASTIRRILIAADPIELNAIYQKWLIEKELAPGEWGAIDGKTMRGTASSPEASDAIQIVTLFSTSAQRALSSGAVASKSNEIPMAQKLIAESCLSDIIWTLDALHTQKKRST